MSEQPLQGMLWTNERMAFRWLEICTEIVRSGKPIKSIDRTAFEQLCGEMRDEYEARIAELEA